MFKSLTKVVLQRRNQIPKTFTIGRCLNVQTRSVSPLPAPDHLRVLVKHFHNTSSYHSCDAVEKDPSTLGKVTRESLVVGASTSLQKTISLEDVRMFSELTGDWNTVHHQKDNPIVHGALLNGLVSGLIGTKLPGPGTLLVKEFLRYPNPCYVGDTVTVTVTLTEISKISTCTFNVVSKMYNNVVMEGEAKLLIKKS